MLLEHLFLALWAWCAVSGQDYASSNTTQTTRTPESKRVLLDLKIVVKPIRPLVEQSAGLDVKLKCEAVLNFKNGRVQTADGNTDQGREKLSLQKVPREYLLSLAKKVNVLWLKGVTSIVPNKRLIIRGEFNESSVVSSLRIRKVEHDDEGNYTCVIKSKNYEEKRTFKVMVMDNLDKEGELPTYKSLYDNLQEEDNTSTTIPTSTFHKKSENIEIKKIEPICQKYVGELCAGFLKGQYVYIPHNTTQKTLEIKLGKAFQVTQYSKDISSHCEDFAIPSLCYSTFPICRNPFITNEMFLKDYPKYSDTEQQGMDSMQPTEIQFENLPPGSLPDLDPSLLKTQLSTTTMSQSNSNSLKDKFDYRHNSTVLRRVCKQDCEILENELCQKEYALAKRHPHIGRELILEDCQDLPLVDPDCLKIDIPEVAVSDVNCYWENGVGYDGIVNKSSSGIDCIMWSKQMFYKPSDFRELLGHNYCRNPGGKESQPYCFIERDGNYVQQVCDISKCAHKIWIYIIIVFLVLILFFSGLLACFCCRNKNKQGATTIRDINLPNADKNIYGNSRLNSPMELNDVDLNINNPCNSSRPRGNGILRVPHYSLSQIKFLEELGEGAFGKVYKGALSRGNDVVYVAVKALKENASAKTKADFRREIELISELRHDNIVCIVGVALREEPLCMLFEFMARGDLHEFLMGRAPPSGKGLPPLRLLNIACHIACGMQYLASHHYVHRDLAARNCLVADDFVVKISDFGLSRDIYSSDYYRVQSKSLLPVRWMPPESILYGKFTTESDIWSYGVVLWEIYSYGLQPYYGFSNQEVIAMVRGGDLLACPTGCPGPIYALMRDCWKQTSSRRPHFEDIANRLRGWIEAGGCGEGCSSESTASQGSLAPRPPPSLSDARERVPLLPPHCSSSNGSLASAGRRKLSIASRPIDDNCSTCSEVPTLPSKYKKGSCGSLVDDRNCPTRDTVVRIHSALGNEI